MRSTSASFPPLWLEVKGVAVQVPLGDFVPSTVRREEWRSNVVRTHTTYEIANLLRNHPDSRPTGFHRTDRRWKLTL